MLPAPVTPGRGRDTEYTCASPKGDPLPVDINVQIISIKALRERAVKLQKKLKETLDALVQSQETLKDKCRFAPIDARTIEALSPVDGNELLPPPCPAPTAPTGTGFAPRRPVAAAPAELSRLLPQTTESAPEPPLAPPLLPPPPPVPATSPLPSLVAASPPASAAEPQRPKPQPVAPVLASAVAAKVEPPNAPSGSAEASVPVRLMKPSSPVKTVVSFPVMQRVVSHSRYMSGHTKKLRALAFNPRDPQQLITSALDHTTRFWNVDSESRKLQESGSIDLSKSVTRLSEFEGWAEDIAWGHSGTVFALALSHSRIDRQVAVFTVTGFPKVTIRILSSEGHTGAGITALGFLTKSDTQLLSVGHDKQLLMWDITCKKKTDLEKIHSEHTAMVCCLHVEDQLVYTGGADTRVICYDLHAKRRTFANVFQGKINSILANPSDGRQLLISQCMKDRQMCIFDTRTEQPTIELNWRGQSANPSQFTTPGWSCSGNLVACGGGVSSVKLWDIRKPSVLQSISCHEKRVSVTTFHPTIDNWLFTASTDRKVGYHDLEIVGEAGAPTCV
eukprot:TRINITY_DN524_c0_g2_i1.p1 TRINITY_DN524_c0_g2~~TRINITY_DN524_c0_g2_i1.p1  ORF type:complete len:562 (-),score=108.50 TRINITY_DN524_c0_g2_i1:39-1724(-)